ncbi:MAG: co-chaperone GroES [Clostridia bacterium]|nr:co-chaperone GroES [Clostridia bacterium]
MVKPLFDKVVLKPFKEEEKTIGGLYISSQKTDNSFMAEVIAVGPGCKIHGEQIPMVVKEGDKVLYNKMNAFEYKIDGQDLIVISQKDILAVVD